MKFFAILVCLLLPILALAGGNAPTTYNAVSDSAPRPEPALPALGGAGTVITDPTFGSRILRVTDGNTQPDYPGASFTTPGGSFEVNWNADTTLFWVNGKGGSVVFRFDAAAMRATPLPDPRNADMPLVVPFNGPFSFRRPNIMYGSLGLKVVEYDFNTNTTRVVFDCAAAVPGVGGNAYTPSVSDDDSRISLAFGGNQDTHPYVAVLDRRTNVYSVLDTQNSCLNGRPANRSLGFGLHSAYMDRTGRYVIMGKGAGRQAGSSEWAVWDVDAGLVYDIEREWSGHDAAGFGNRVNQAGFYGGEPAFYEEQQWAIRGLGENDVNNIQYLLDWRNLPAPHEVIRSEHHSWNNARPDALVPVVGSVVRDSRKSGAPWRKWDNEIIAVATDGSGQVWRFAHHRSVYDRNNFWDDPRGNVSQDGRYFAFTSNWGESLGAGRCDVFIVELAAGASAPAAQPGGAPPYTQTQPGAGPQPVTPAAPPEYQPPATPAAVPVAPQAPENNTAPGDPNAPVAPVTLLTPLNGASIPAGGVFLSAAVSADLAGVSVQFFVDGSPAGVELASRYELYWMLGPGEHTIAAQARDASGDTRFSTVARITVE